MNLKVVLLPAPGTHRFYGEYPILYCPVLREGCSEADGYRVYRADREGQNYYRIEGRELKEVSATDWLKIKPLLAIFTRQTSSAAGRDGWSGRRRRRSDPGCSSERYAAASLAGKAMPSEVIEVTDDDADNSGARYSDDFVGIRPHPVGESMEVSSQLDESAWSANVEVRGRSLKRRPPGALLINEHCESRGAEDAVQPAGAGNTNVEQSGARLAKAHAGKVVLDVDAKQADEGPQHCKTNRERGSEITSDGPRRPSPPQTGLSDDPWLRQGGNWGAREGFEADGDSRGRNTCATKKKKKKLLSRSDPKSTWSHADPAPGNDESKMEIDDDVQLVSGELLSGDAAVVALSCSKKTSRGALNSMDMSAAEERTDERLMHSHNRAGAVAMQSASDRECVASMDCGDVFADSLVDAVNASAELRSRRIDETPKTTALFSLQDHPDVQSLSTHHVVNSCDDESTSAICQADVSGSRLSCVGMPFMGQTRPPTTGSPVHHMHHSATQMEDRNAPTSEEHNASRKRDHATSGVGGGDGCDGSSAQSLAEEVTAVPPLRAVEIAKMKDTVELDGKDRDAEWIRSGSEALEVVSGVPIRRNKRKKGCEAGGVNGSIEGEQALEDLTGPEGPEHKATDKGVHAACASSLGSRQNKIEPTLTTIRGIKLRHDHFERILDSDGWLTSQVMLIIPGFSFFPGFFCLEFIATPGNF